MLRHQLKQAKNASRGPRAIVADALEHQEKIHPSSVRSFVERSDQLTKFKEIQQIFEIVQCGK